MVEGRGRDDKALSEDWRDVVYKLGWGWERGGPEERRHPRGD